MRNSGSLQLYRLKQYAVLRVALGMTMLFFAQHAFAQDSASVKIRVDLDDVVLTVNADTINVDSHGSRLTKHAWFILNLPAADYKFVFDHADFEPQHESVSLDSSQIISFEITFLPPVAPPELITGALIVQSEPDSAAILVDGVALTSVTPADLDLGVGERMVEVIGFGFEPLSRAVIVDSMHRTILNYILMPLPPPELTADSLGLVYDVQLPKLAEEKAKTMRKQFNAMAETFAIIPLGQGLLAKILLDHDDQRTANVLVISGAVLTAGSYILGRILSKKKLREIRLENEEIDGYNARAAITNSEVDQSVKEANKQAYKEYLDENKGRGRIQVTVE